MAAKPYTAREMQTVAARVKATLLHAEGDGEVIDTLGDISSIESRLAALRRGAAAEYEDGMRGDRWQFTQGRTSKKSYNTPRLIRRFSKYSGESLIDTVFLLVKLDALRLTWHWTNLERAADQIGVPLTTARHEIAHGDDADVGVYYKDGYPKYTPIK